MSLSEESEVKPSLPGDQAYGPTASLSVLRLRADMLNWVRGFFREQGYWEVETPLLSRDVCIDAWLEPYCVPGSDGGPCDDATGDSARVGPLYLQTSPEFGMKRLLAAGAKSIVQITRAFRQEECGPLHNPEFTIIEWYQAGGTYPQQMQFVERLTVGFQSALRRFRTAPRASGDAADLSLPEGRSLPDGTSCRGRDKPVPAVSSPFGRLTYEEAFVTAMGEAVLSLSADQLARLAVARGIVSPRSLGADDRDGWLDLLFLEFVEPMLAEREAVFVCDYPDTQAALARIRPGDPPVAERFELYLQGVEICNGYQELTDPGELRRRFAGQSEKRRREGRPPLPRESRLLKAMDSGMPESAGVALGFDRLLMILLGAERLDEVLAFPFHRA